jgi:hypothetical protein
MKKSETASLGIFNVEQETEERRRSAQTLAMLRGVKVEDLKEKTNEDVERALHGIGVKVRRPVGP